MSEIQNIKSILDEQKSSLSKLDKEIEALSNSDFLRENHHLKEEVTTLKSQLTDTNQKLSQISEENKGLKNALYQQIYNEKISILKLSAKKLDIYFKSKSDGPLNRLTTIENNAKKKINNMTQLLHDNNIALSDELYTKLNELNAMLDQKITKIRESFVIEKGSYSNYAKSELIQLKEEQITDEQIIASVQKSNWEAFIGQNIINKIGILLVIIGVIAASQFTYLKLPDILKCILIYLLGGAMLGFGELLNRKRPNLVSLGITAGGVAILYIGTSVSYFMYGVLGMYPALFLCILITTVSFLLSKRYHSATIASFSLIGGYLPMLSVSDSITLIWGAMVYFIILNLFMLLLSFHRKWTVCYYIGFVLNLLGTCFLIWSYVDIFNIFSLGISSNTGDYSELLNFMICILYITFAFGIYTVVPIISNYTQKLQFKKSDITLIALNTVFSSMIMYCTFFLFGLTDYNGLLAILFALIYVVVGKFVEIKLTHEKRTIALFYLTGFAFVVLVIPIQFGAAWLSLGWLVEGVGLLVYGILNDIKSFKKGGYLIGALCIAAFLLNDLVWYFDDLFAYKYFALTLGSLLVLGSYIYKKSLSNRFEILYKYVTLINFWIYAIYIVNVKLSEVIKLKIFDEYYITCMLAIGVSFFIAYMMPRIKTLHDRGVQIISHIIVLISIFWLFSTNAMLRNPIEIYSDIPLSYHLMLAFIIVVIDLVAVFALYDMVRSVILKNILGVEWLPFISLSYILLILTQNLTAQFNLSFTNMFISIIYVVTALLWIILGFVKRYTLIRKFGLGLSICSVVKLFIMDLSYLTEGSKIISYFALGASLIAISFVYQYFSKRLEIKGGIVKND